MSLFKMDVKSIGDYISDICDFAIKTAYPAYASYIALSTEDSNDIGKWLLYWTVLSCFTFLESFFKPYLSYVPFFSHIRVLFLLWLQIPFFNGPYIIARSILVPFFHKNKVILDRIFPTDVQSIKESFRLLIEKICDIYFQIKEHLDSLENN